MNTSQIRKDIRKHSKTIADIIETMVGRSPLFPGSLYEHKARCGKPQCKCAKSSYRHQMLCLSFVDNGKSRTRVVRKGDIETVRKMTEDYRQFREARHQIKDLMDNLMAAVDALGEARCSLGRDRYERLNARKAKAISSKTDNKGSE